MKRLFTTDPISQAQIDAWKKDYKNVFAITVLSGDANTTSDVTVSETGLTGYFRKPTIEELGVSTQGNKENPLKATLVIYNTCLLGGHPDFDSDEDVKMAAIGQFKDIIKTREASIKKL